MCSNHLYLLLTKGWSRPGGQTQAHSSLLPHKPGMATVCCCLRKKSRFRAVGWRGGVCSRGVIPLLLHPRMLFIGNPTHLFFFFLIDFSRVGGKTLQMQMKKGGKMQARQEDLGREPQPCFGLELRVEKGSGVHTSLAAKVLPFCPECQHLPPPPRLLPAGGRPPPRRPL